MGDRRGLDAKILVFWMLSFKPVFSLSSFTFTQRLFSSSSLSSIRMVSSAYLRLLIFLLAILILACASSTLTAESEEELKSLLMKMKEESEKVGLKLTIQKTKIMASSPITSWEIDGETVETGSDFIWGGSKITADGDCSHEIKRHSLLGRKAITNLYSKLKSRDIIWKTKVHLVKAMVFPAVIYECESWNIKKAKCQRTDAFKLWWEDSWESLGLQGDQTSQS